MRGQPAKILRAGELRRVLAATGRSRHPERNRAMVLLSVTAGLRACEVAALTWDMVLTARGEVAAVIELPGWAAKKGSGRRVPIHPDLKLALRRLKTVAAAREGPVILSERGDRMIAKSV